MSSGFRDIEKVATKIKRVDMLREFDVKETKYSKQHVFSIIFITAKGERVFLPRAVATGVNCSSMKAHRLRGMVAVVRKGDKVGHIYPVRIDNIKDWNGKVHKFCYNNKSKYI